MGTAEEKSTVEKKVRGREKGAGDKIKIKKKREETLVSYGKEQKKYMSL